MKNTIYERITEIPFGEEDRKMWEHCERDTEWVLIFDINRFAHKRNFQDLESKECNYYKWYLVGRKPQTWKIYHKILRSTFCENVPVENLKNYLTYDERYDKLIYETYYE